MAATGLGLAAARAGAALRRLDDGPRRKAGPGACADASRGPAGRLQASRGPPGPMGSGPGRGSGSGLNPLGLVRAAAHPGPEPRGTEGAGLKSVRARSAARSAPRSERAAALGAPLACR